MAESLLPDTHAIRKETLEWEPNYHGKHLVRYKDVNGTPFHTVTASWDEANAAFEKHLADMRAKCRARRDGGFPNPQPLIPSPEVLK